jgi:hypothetical protein
LKKDITQKRAGGVAQGVGPEFKPQYHKKTKTKTKKDTLGCHLQRRKCPHYSRSKDQDD